MLRKYCHLLEKISFLSPSDVYRLIHTEATVTHCNLWPLTSDPLHPHAESYSSPLSVSQMLNQSLLANRRSVARLLLLLQEDNLQQESLLRLHWEDCLSRWRRRKVNEVIDRFRWVKNQEIYRFNQVLQRFRQLIDWFRWVENQENQVIDSICMNSFSISTIYVVGVSAAVMRISSWCQFSKRFRRWNEPNEIWQNNVVTSSSRSGNNNRDSAVNLLCLCPSHCYTVLKNKQQWQSQFS